MGAEECVISWMSLIAGTIKEWLHQENMAAGSKK